MRKSVRVVETGTLTHTDALLGRRVLPQLNEHIFPGWWSPRSTLLHWSAGRQDAAICRALLSRSDFTEVNACDIANLTALHLAAYRGNEEICRLILQHEAFSAARTRARWGVNNKTAA